MSVSSYLKTHTSDLSGKTAVVTGATGGLGRELCRYLCSLNCKLILVNRSETKAKSLEAELTGEYPKAVIYQVLCDLEDICSVKTAAADIEKIGADILIHNAGAYDIPRHKCSTGYDNVFQIDFVSQYYLTDALLPMLKSRNGAGVVAVGSIAHNYSKTDKSDIDFSSRKSSAKVYGNAKRYLMFSLHEMFRDKSRVGDVKLSVVHPGITFTNITAHYPKLIFAIIKNPMKVIFMSRRKACLSLIRGVFEATDYGEWLGPRFFNVWGYPRKSKIGTVSAEESVYIGETADNILEKIRGMC